MEPKSSQTKVGISARFLEGTPTMAKLASCPAGKAEIPVEINVNHGDATIQDIGFIRVDPTDITHKWDNPKVKNLEEPDENLKFGFLKDYTDSTLSEASYASFPNQEPVPSDSVNWDHSRPFGIFDNGCIDTMKARVYLIAYATLSGYRAGPGADPETITIYSSMEATNSQGVELNFSILLTLIYIRIPPMELKQEVFRIDQWSGSLGNITTKFYREKKELTSMPTEGSIYRYSVKYPCHKPGFPCPHEMRNQVVPLKSFKWHWETEPDTSGTTNPYFYIDNWLRDKDSNDGNVTEFCRHTSIKTEFSEIETITGIFHGTSVGGSIGYVYKRKDSDGKYQHYTFPYTFERGDAVFTAAIFRTPVLVQAPNQERFARDAKIILEFEDMYGQKLNIKLDRSIINGLTTFEQ